MDAALVLAEEVLPPAYAGDSGCVVSHGIKVVSDVSGAYTERED